MAGRPPVTLLVSGNGPHLHIVSLSIGDDGAVAGSLAGSVATHDATPWASRFGDRGLLLVQKRASDKTSAVRLATVDAAAAGSGGAPLSVAVSPSAVALGGSDPVHGSVDPHGGGWAVVAHGGDLRACAVGAPGGGDPPVVVIPVGSKCSQALWHPRVPQTLYATNLGADAVLRFEVAHPPAPPPAPGAPPTQLAQRVALPPGSGPRRMALSPCGTAAYVINELAATLSVLRVDPATGALSPPVGPPVSTLPPGGGPNGGGVITSAQVLASPDGRWVLASNRCDRGGDSIALFAVGGGDPTALAAVAWATPATAAADVCGGDGAGAGAPAPSALLRVPRDMCLLRPPPGGGEAARLYVAVANQAADSVGLFAVEEGGEGGEVGAARLRCVGAVALPPGSQPTCVLQW